MVSSYSTEEEEPRVSGRVSPDTGVSDFQTGLDEMVASYSDPEEAAPADDSWEVTKGLKRGAIGFKGLGIGGASWLLSAIGDEEGSEIMFDAYQKNQELMEKHKAAVTGLDDLAIGEEGWIGRAGDLVAGTLGEMVPDIVGFMVSGGFGSMIGKQVVKSGIKSKLKGELTKEIAEKGATAAAIKAGETTTKKIIEKRLTDNLGTEASKKVMADGMKKWASGGALTYGVGAGTSSVYTGVREFGERPGADPTLDYDRPGLAAALGLPMGFLDIFVPKAVFGKIAEAGKATKLGKQLQDLVGIELGKPQNVKKIKELTGAGRTVKVGQVAGIASAQEAGTEGAQEFIQQIAYKIVDTRHDLFGPEARASVADAMVKGGIGGFFLGGAGSAASQFAEHAVEKNIKAEQAQAKLSEGMNRFEQIPSLIENVDELEDLGAELDSQVLARGESQQTNAVRAGIQKKINDAKADRGRDALELAQLEQDAARQQQANTQRNEAALNDDSAALASQMADVAQEGGAAIEVKGVQSQDIAQEPSAKAPESATMIPEEVGDITTVATEEKGVDDGLEPTQRSRGSLGSQKGEPVYGLGKRERDAERTGPSDQQVGKPETGEATPAQALGPPVDVKAKPRGGVKAAPTPKAKIKKKPTGPKPVTKTEAKRKQELINVDKRIKTGTKRLAELQRAHKVASPADKAKRAAQIEQKQKTVKEDEAIRDRLISPKKAPSKKKTQSLKQYLKKTGLKDNETTRTYLEAEDLKGVMRKDARMDIEQLLTDAKESGFVFDPPEGMSELDFFADKIIANLQGRESTFSTLEGVPDIDMSKAEMIAFSESVAIKENYKDLQDTRIQVLKNTTDPDLLHEQLSLIDERIAFVREDVRVDSNIPFSANSGLGGVAPYTIVPGGKASLLTQLAKQSGTKIHTVVPKAGHLTIANYLTDNFKTNTVFFVPEDGRKLPVNGFSDKAANTIYVNTKSDNYPIQVAMHELGHQITEGADWGQIKAFYEAEINSTPKTKASFDAYAKRLSENPQYAERIKADPDLVMKEWFSDYFGESALDWRLWQDLNQYNPGLFTRIANHLMDIFQKMKNYVMGSPIRTIDAVASVERSRGQLAAILNKYSRDRGVIERTTIDAFGMTQLLNFTNPYTSEDVRYEAMRKRGEEMKADSPHLNAPWDMPGFTENSIPEVQFSVTGRVYTDEVKAAKTIINVGGSKGLMERLTRGLSPKELISQLFREAQIGIFNRYEIFDIVDKKRGKEYWEHDAIAGVIDLNHAGGMGAMETIMEEGPVIMDEKGLILLPHPDNKDGDGMEQIIGEAQGEIYDVFEYMAGGRVKNMPEGALRKRALPKVEGQTVDETADALMSLAEGEMPSGDNRAVLYPKLAKKIMALSRSVLKIARIAGIISAESEKNLNKNIFHVPFWKIAIEEEKVTGRVNPNKLINAQEFKNLKGSDAPIGNLLENWIKNLSWILNTSATNVAAKHALNGIVELKLLQTKKTKSEIAAEVAPLAKMMEETKDTVLEKELRKQIADINAANKTKGPDYWVLDKGERRYFELAETPGATTKEINENKWVADQVLMAFTQISKLPMDFFGLPSMKFVKGVLTKAITNNPSFFMWSNPARDLPATMHLEGQSLNPVKVMKNAIKASKSESLLKKQMRAAGGTFPEYDVADAQKAVKRLARQGVNASNTLDNEKGISNARKMALAAGRKALGLLGKVKSYSENFARLSIAQNIIDMGKVATPEERAKGKGGLRHAAIKGRGAMDFAKRGSWQVIEMLIATVPFLGPRLQGLFVTGKGSGFLEGDTVLQKITPRKNFFVMTASLMATSAFLAVLNYDDEEYQNDPDWLKDTMWSVRIGDTRFYIPKPFELGILPTTVEHITKGFMDEAAGVGFQKDEFGDFVMRSIMGTLSFNPIPQIFVPIAELKADQSFFYRTPIEGHFMRSSTLPTERIRNRTSTFAQVASKVNNWVDPTSKQEYTASPVQIDHLLSGYFGWMGRLATESFDGLYDITMGVEGESPDRAFRDWPVIGEPSKRLFAAEVPSNTKASSEFYELLGQTQIFTRSVKKMIDEGNIEGARKLQTKHGNLMAARSFASKMQKQVGTLNKQMKEIGKSTYLSGSQKREMLDRLQLRKNQMLQSAVGRLNMAKTMDRRYKQ